MSGIGIFKVSYLDACAAVKLVIPESGSDHLQACPKECSLTDTNESCDCAKNDGANQTEKHSGARGIPKIYLSFLVVPTKGSKRCAQNAKFLLTVGKYLFATGLQFNRMTHFFEAFGAES